MLKYGKKTSYLFFAPSKIKQDLAFQLYFKGDSPNNDVKINRIEQGQSVRLLGVWIDSNLSFSDHVDKLQKKLSFALFAMRKVRNFINNDSMKLLYNAFFHSHLEFSSTFLLSCKKNAIR